METTPLPPYLIFARSVRSTTRLRRYLVPAKWRQMKSLRRKVGFIGVVAGWPLIAGYFAWNESRRHGQRVQQLTGRGRWRQFIEQWQLASWYGLAPHAYYKYGLFDSRRRSLAPDYLHNQELGAIVTSLNPNEDTSTFSDKVRFDELCLKNGLARIPILAVFKSGRVTYGEVRSPADLPARDLFTKPTN